MEFDRLKFIDDKTKLTVYGFVRNSRSTHQSQNHKNQEFRVVIQPNNYIDKLPLFCEVYECRSSKIIVKSKSPQKTRCSECVILEVEN